jgi:putative membrane protein
MADTTQTPARRNRRDQARTGALVVLSALITLFAVLNVKEVEVNWIFGKSQTPLIIVIVISLLVGILLTHFAEAYYKKRKDKHHG